MRASIPLRARASTWSPVPSPLVLPPKEVSRAYPTFLSLRHSTLKPTFLYFTLADMTGDLKTGYLLRAKPKNQFVAQLVGAIVAVFLTTGLFVLFTTAAPCILYPPATGECALYLNFHFLRDLVSRC